MRAAGFFAVPHFARNALQDFVRQHYGRTLTIGGIQFNPFTLALDVTGFSLPDADGQPLIAFDRLHVSLQLASLWRFAPSFREILLEQPYVRAVVRQDGALNLADLGKGFARPAAQAATEVRAHAVVYPAPGGAFRAPRRSRTARRAVSRRVQADRLRAARLQHHAREPATTTRSNAASPEGERLMWSGSVRLEPLASHGEFEISDSAGAHAVALPAREPAVRDRPRASSASRATTI